MLPKNIDTTGRLIRFLFGLFFLVLAVYFHSAILLLAAIFCIFEALMSWCFFYHLLGINKCPLGN